MASETETTPVAEQPAPETTPPVQPRYRFGIILIAGYWIFESMVRWFEPSMFMLFISRFGVLLLFSLGFTIWWLANRSLARRDKWYAVAVTTVGMILAMVLAVPGMALSIMGGGIPLAFSFGLGWLVLTRWARPTFQRAGLFVVVWGVWTVCALQVWDGLNGDQSSSWHWRWQASAEKKFLEEHAARNEDVPSELLTRVVALAPGDVPAFRGVERSGVYAGIVPMTDWQANPPKKVWEQRVGPAWSSMIHVDGRLYTQEQRGDMEAVVCYDAATGKEIWAHQEQARFNETVSGLGPRATPTFEAGKILAAGATGKLCCLDAASGNVIWTRDVAADAGAKPQQWGYSTSPLVVNGLVVTFAGGTEYGLVAYHLKDGEPAWHVATGPGSYSSPQLSTLQGTPQILFISDAGLIGVEPATGKQLWQQELAGSTLPAIQPHVLADGSVLAQSKDGLMLVEVRHEGDAWYPSVVWQGRALRPSFNDVVVHKNAIFGLDEGIFGCLDARTGKRLWKGGRYRYGQVVLLPDAGLLLVIAENGDGVLVAADPAAENELARVPLIEGKTWNHPLPVGNRLYVRNAEHMACYELKMQKP